MNDYNDRRNANNDIKKKIKDKTKTDEEKESFYVSEEADKLIKEFEKNLEYRNRTIIPDRVGIVSHQQLPDVSSFCRSVLSSLILREVQSDPFLRSPLELPRLVQRPPHALRTGTDVRLHKRRTLRLTSQ